MPAPAMQESTSETTPVLAEGLQRYVELMRASAGRSGIAAARLHSDLNADVFRQAPATPMQSLTTFIVMQGQEIAVRLHHPGFDVTRPAICYFHGGGFSFGSLDSFDAVAAGLARHSGAVVASVQYRRLPENSYRDAQEDCYAALGWLYAHAEDLGIDRHRLAVAGDSVGALLATTAAMMARDRGGPEIACQLLMYGAFALRPGRDSYAHSRDPLLTPQRLDSFIQLYQRTRDETFYPPPLAMQDLAALPAALMVIAEHDPLGDEAQEYAQRLRDSAVPVELSVAPGMIHGFFRAMSMCPAAEREMQRFAQTARRYLWPDHGASTHP